MRITSRVTAAMALAALCGHAWAVPVRTAFTGEGSWDVTGTVRGYFEYESSEAVETEFGYLFDGGSTKFFALRADGLELVGTQFTMWFLNDSGGPVACDPLQPCDALFFRATYYDPIWGGYGSMLFNVFDPSGQMFSPDVTSLAQTNIPLVIPYPADHGGLFQFDEIMGGSLGGFRITSLTPLPEPGTALIFGVAVILLGAHALRSRSTHRT